jgi:hypothetical protein
MKCVEYINEWMSTSVDHEKVGCQSFLFVQIHWLEDLWLWTCCVNTLSSEYLISLTCIWPRLSFLFKCLSLSSINFTEHMDINCSKTVPYWCLHSGGLSNCFPVRIAGLGIPIYVPNVIEKPPNITQTMPVWKISSTAILVQAVLLLHSKLFQIWRKPSPSHLKWKVDVKQWVTFKKKTMCSPN